MSPYQPLRPVPMDITVTVASAVISDIALGDITELPPTE